MLLLTTTTTTIDASLLSSRRSRRHSQLGFLLGNVPCRGVMDLLLILVLLGQDVRAESTATATAAQHSFSIREVTLSVEPSAEVSWGASAVLRCQAELSKPVNLTGDFTIFKGRSAVVCRRRASSLGELRCPLAKLSLAHAGRYRCVVTLEGREGVSKAQTLTVTGVPAPVLHLSASEATEGEEVTVGCTAPVQASQFYFYEDSNEFEMMEIRSNRTEVKHRLTSSGSHRFHCSYKVLVDTSPYQSENSKAVTVSVKELAVMPVLEITGPQKIYEGDRLFLECSTNTSLPSATRVDLLLKQGSKFLGDGLPKVNRSVVVRTAGPTEFKCELEVGKVVKTTSKTISVAELFPAPTLTMSPAQVFQREDVTFTCRSDGYASERLSGSQLIYSLDPEYFFNPKSNGVFSGKAPRSELNVSCVAEDKGIIKRSKVFTLRPKVPVSVPEISVAGDAILGRPVRIRCRSRAGSPPITYTLMTGFTNVSSTTVQHTSDEAFFTVDGASDLRSYMCVATNGPKNEELSARLNAAVTVPLSNPTLIVIPEISEGDELQLICSVRGTPPVTFKWYRSDTTNPLDSVSVYSNFTIYRIPVASRQDSGMYRCEADNPAERVVSTDFVAVEVRMAVWKKALIGGGVCALVLSVLLVVLLLYFKSRKAKTNRAEISVWTQRPPETEFFPDTAEPEESSALTSEPDVEYTEVVHAQPADPSRVPRRQGTDTVYSELQNSPPGTDDHYNHGSAEYTTLSGEHKEVIQCKPEVNSRQDRPSSMG